jgi:hypothetical protein
MRRERLPKFASKQSIQEFVAVVSNTNIKRYFVFQTVLNYNLLMTFFLQVVTMFQTRLI